MSNLRDVASKDDLERIIFQFYKVAIKDEHIGHYFTDVVQLNLELHLPIIVSFWESSLFRIGSYSNDTLEVHRMINTKHAFKAVDFDRWLTLFNQTIDQLYAGNIAETMKTRASSIAMVMQLKLKED